MKALSKGEQSDNREQSESKLEGGNIIEHMRKFGQMKADIHSYFYFNSPVMKAIIKHVCSEKCCLIKHPYKRLKYWRGQGPVSFGEAYTWGTQYDKNSKPYQSPDYRLTFKVSYIPNDEYDDEFGDNAETIKYEVDVPIDLELNFTQKAFDKWCKEEGEKRQKESEKKSMEILKKVFKEHPKLIKEFFENEAQSGQQK